MCNKKPGLRCSTHAMQALASVKMDAIREKQENGFVSDATRERHKKAEFEYHLTPAGLAEVDIENLTHMRSVADARKKSLAMLEEQEQEFASDPYQMGEVDLPDVDQIHLLMEDLEETKLEISEEIDRFASLIEREANEGRIPDESVFIMAAQSRAKADRVNGLLINLRKIAQVQREAEEAAASMEENSPHIQGNMRVTRSDNMVSLSSFISDSPSVYGSVVTGQVSGGGASVGASIVEGKILDNAPQPLLVERSYVGPNGVISNDGDEHGNTEIFDASIFGKLNAKRESKVKMSHTNGDVSLDKTEMRYSQVDATMTAKDSTIEGSDIVGNWTFDNSKVISSTISGRGVLKDTILNDCSIDFERAPGLTIPEGASFKNAHIEKNEDFLQLTDSTLLYKTYSDSLNRWGVGVAGASVHRDSMTFKQRAAYEAFVARMEEETKTAPPRVVPSPKG